MSFIAKIGTTSQQKSVLFVQKRDYKLQYFTLRTIKRLGDLSLQNVFTILVNLRLDILINSLVTKKSIRGESFI